MTQFDQIVVSLRTVRTQCSHSYEAWHRQWCEHTTNERLHKPSKQAENERNESETYRLQWGRMFCNRTSDFDSLPGEISIMQNR